MAEDTSPTDFTQLNAEADEMALAQLGGVKNPDSSKGVIATFYMGAVENSQKTLAEGRPIFDDVAFVRIQVRGDKDNIVETPAWIDKTGRHPMAHNVRFPEQWLRFRAGQEQGGSGTPLAMMPGITKGQVAELAHFQVKTIEDLAEMSDSTGQGHRGFYALRQRAQDYIASASKAAPLQQARAEMEALRSKNETLERQLAEQAQRIDELAAKAGVPVPTSAPVAPPPQAPKAKAPKAKAPKAKR